MGMGPGLPVAMLACARLGAPHTVVFGGFSAESLAGRLNDMQCEVLITQDEGWRRGPDGPAQGERGRGARVVPRRADTSSSASARARTSRCGRDATSPGHELVDGQPSDPASCPCEPMDAEDLLYLLYTSGTTAKPKGIAHTTAGYLVGVATTHRLRLRPQARDRRLLVRRRHRLGDRAQLHRLRAALQRHDERPVRGHAGLPGQGPVVGHRRALRGDDPVHGADGHPRAHEVGPGARGEARPVLAPPARDASASRSTPRRGCGTGEHIGADRLPGRRHVVADGDGDDPDHAAAGGHDAEARLGDEAVPRGRGRGRRRQAARGRSRRAAATSC